MHTKAIIVRYFDTTIVTTPNKMVWYENSRKNLHASLLTSKSLPLPTFFHCNQLQPVITKTLITIYPSF